MIFFDKKELFVFEKNQPDLTEPSALLSNNSSFISLANDYFNMLWRNLEEENPRVNSSI